MVKNLLLPAVIAAALAVSATPVFAQQQTEGKVVSTKLTLCNFKPGGCEGNLVLEPLSGGKSNPMTIKVPLGTPIKKGNEVVYLPTLRGSVVKIDYVDVQGEHVAKSVEVKAAMQ